MRKSSLIFLFLGAIHSHSGSAADVVSVDPQNPLNLDYSLKGIQEPSTISIGQSPLHDLEQGQNDVISAPSYTMHVRGLRAQMLEVAKRRTLSPRLKEELLSIFGEGLPEELKRALEDPAFTALLPNLRASRSLVPSKTPESRMTKEYALKPIKALSDACAAAYCFNPELEMARKKINLAVNQLAKAWSAMRPQVMFNMGHNQRGFFQKQRGNNALGRDEDGLPTTNIQAREHKWVKQANITAKQTLFAGGGIIARIMKAKAEFLAACWSYTVAEQNILIKVSEAFLDYLLADDLLRMEEINAATLHMLFKASSVGFSAGVEKAGDRSIAAGQALIEGDAKVIEARRQKDTNRVKLQTLIGAPIDILDELTMPTQFTKVPKTVKELKTQMLKDNPSIKASTLMLVGKKHEVIAAQAEFLPKVEIEGSVNRDLGERTQNTHPSYVTNWTKDGTSAAQFGVGLTIPIYDRGLTHANLRTTEQEVKFSRLELEQNKRTVLWEGVQQWNTLSASLVNQSLAFRAMLFYTQALINAQKEYDAGVLPIVDFTRIQSSWISACRTWISQRFAVVKSSIAVAGYLGKMTAKTLKLPVALFNPRKYYEEYATNWTGIGSDEAENALFDLDPLARKE